MDETKMYAFLLDHDRIPTLQKFEHAAVVSLKNDVYESTSNTQVQWNSDGEFYEWFVENDAVANRTGRWILTMATLSGGISNVSDLSSKYLESNFVLSTL